MLLAASLVAGWAGTVLAQAPPASPRTATPTPASLPSGTGAIAVIVVDDIGVPVPRVMVTLTYPAATAGPSGQSGLAEAPPGTLEVTGSDGRCVFRNLGPGRSALLARSDSRHTSIAAVERIDLHEGKPETVTMRVDRAGVIVGTVVAIDGAPVVGAQVAAIGWSNTRANRRALAVRRSASTDDRGQYRLFGLEAEVVATESVGLITGRVTGADGQPAPGHMVVAFPDDETRIVSDGPAIVSAPSLATWHRLPPALLNAGWTRDTLAGAFHLPLVPAGNYRIVALRYDSPQPVATLDPELLRRLRPTATRVSVSPGQHVVLTLLATTPPELDAR